MYDDDPIGQSRKIFDLLLPAFSVEKFALVTSLRTDPRRLDIDSSIGILDTIHKIKRVSGTRRSPRRGSHQSGPSVPLCESIMRHVASNPSLTLLP